MLRKMDVQQINIVIFTLRLVLVQYLFEFIRAYLEFLSSTEIRKQPIIMKHLQVGKTITTCILRGIWYLL